MEFNNKFARVKKLRKAVTTAIATTEEKGSADKPGVAHLRRFNIITNYVDIIVISMYF